MDACYFFHRAAISQAPCVAGEGPGCVDAAEDNPLVKRLQENSRKNKEANNQAMLEKYWREGCVGGAGGLAGGRGAGGSRAVVLEGVGRGLPSAAVEGGRLACSGAVAYLGMHAASRGGLGVGVVFFWGWWRSRRASDRALNCRASVTALCTRVAPLCRHARVVPDPLDRYNSYFSFGYNQTLQKDEATGNWSLVSPENPIAKILPKPNSIGK